MEKDLMLPNFIVVGGTKCGTTALWLNCDKHPDISMVGRAYPGREKIAYEIKFWKHKNWNMGIEWYRSLFKNRPGILGEKCAGYIYRKRSMVAISNHIPNVKIIFSLRNPVDRMYSNYQMNYKSGKVKKSFEDNLKRYWGRSEYYKLIKRNILPFYNKDQFYICIMERLKNNTRKEMNKIFSFLGVSDLNYETKDVRALGKSYDFLERNRSEKFYRRWSIQESLNNKELYLRLMKYFDDDMKKLKEFLNDDIPEWGN